MLSAVNLASSSKSLLSREQEGNGYGESWRSQASGTSSCSSTTSPAGAPGPWAMLGVHRPTKNGLGSRDLGLTLVFSHLFQICLVPGTCLGQTSSLDIFFVYCQYEHCNSAEKKFNKVSASQGAARGDGKANGHSWGRLHRAALGGNLAYASRSRFKVHPLTLAPQCLLLPTPCSSD